MKKRCQSLSRSAGLSLSKPSWWKVSRPATRHFAVPQGDPPSDSYFIAACPGFASGLYSVEYTGISLPNTDL
jgi:hypothetical protein